MTNSDAQFLCTAVLSVVAWFFLARTRTLAKERDEARQQVELTVKCAFESVQAIAKDNAELRAQKDQAYSERNKLVAFLSKVFPAHLKWHEGDDWENDWRTIVCIHGPAGQMSWHIHKSERPLFQHLEQNPFMREPCGQNALDHCQWDGHSTEEKYQRLSKIACRLQA